MTVDTSLTYTYFTISMKRININMISHQVMQILLWCNADGKNEQHYKCKNPLYDLMVFQ
jgi:hypothetical protein